MVRSDDISKIKGIGEKTAPLYRKLGLNSVDDIIHDFPRDYVYYNDVCDINSDNIIDIIAFEATVIKRPLLKTIGRYRIVTAELVSNGTLIKATWFNMPYLTKSLEVNKNYIFRGYLEPKAEYYKIEQPEIFSVTQYKNIQSTFQPIYSLTKGLSNNALSKTVKFCLNELNLTDDILFNIHFPKTKEQLFNARQFFVYEEFLLFLLRMKLLKESNEENINDFNIIPVAQTRRIIEKLPYKLTNSQIKVFEEVEEDICSKKSMSRLIQGDVGCGKTIIAVLSCITVALNGYQCAVMAPTEILARQHFDTFLSILKENNISINVILLTGSLNAKEKKECYKKIANKEVDIIIGTHALIQEKVVYNNLALVVTDEQHRFGVNQRENLASKNNNAIPHVLVMSATPIPRTLAMILYSDLDISVINEVPAQRLPIKNCVVGVDYRNSAYKFIQKEISLGHQVYIICPLVEKSEALEANDVVTYSEKLKLILPDNINIGCLHGKMKAKDKQNVMNLFSNGDIDILVSTTVVEVGVNVPNATVMLIENADRFGLAQLHQLRGRIGRGSFQSYCIFISGSKKKKTMERLNILNKSNDGFFIASEDLKMRGPGDIFGVRQSGELQFRLADIYSDANILKKASEDADRILEDDPNLEKEQNKELKIKLENYMKNGFDNYSI